MIMIDKRYSKNCQCFFSKIMLWFFLLGTIFWLLTRSKTLINKVHCNSKTSHNKINICSELTSISDRVSFIWTSTRDAVLRKSSSPCRHRYGLEFKTKHKNLHLILFLMLAGDIASNPGPESNQNNTLRCLSDSLQRPPSMSSQYTSLNTQPLQTTLPFDFDDDLFQASNVVTSESFNIVDNAEIENFHQPQFKVTPYDENIDFVLFYIFIDLYRGASDLSISANIF